MCEAPPPVLAFVPDGVWVAEPVSIRFFPLAVDRDIVQPSAVAPVPHVSTRYR